MPGRLEPTAHEDRRLVRRLRAGDTGAFDEFWAQHAERLYRFARARTGGDRELAGEAVQSALCKALDGLDSYRAEGSLFAWICGICRFEITAALRRKGRRPREVPLDGHEEGDLVQVLRDETDDPEAALLRSEARTRVHEVLDRLPRHYAEALEWKYAARLPVREIAARLELSEKAAESLLTRARSSFRQTFEELRAADTKVSEEDR